MKTSKTKKSVLRKFFSALPLFICLSFFIAYSVLTVVRHLHYQSFGYDLGINDQVVWRYSRFQLPLDTIDPFPTRTKFVEHVELVYALVAPFYWLYSSPITLIIVRNAWFCFSALAVFLLTRKKRLHLFLCYSFMVVYLLFYGVQNAMWTDVHSNSFAAAFVLWFIYCIETKRKKLSVLFFLLAITAKENIGLVTFLVSLVYFVKERSKLQLFFMITSFAYITFIFFIFFPSIMHVQYLYSNKGGLFSSLDPRRFYDTAEKRSVIFFSLLSFGFLPLLAPLELISAIGNLAIYFVIASDLPGAQGLYGHYRIGLAVYVTFAAVYAIIRYKRLNTWYIGVYLLVCSIAVQYMLHLPLSYLVKPWFWTKPSGVNSITKVIQEYLPNNASVVAQDNIIPHISHREEIYTLYPEKKTFQNHSPCGQKECDWFHWYGTPAYLLVDTSSDWDARHLLTDRPNFINGLRNLEKSGVIAKYQQQGTTILYTVKENPVFYP